MKFTKDNCEINYEGYEVVSVDYVDASKTYVVTFEHNTTHISYTELFREDGEGIHTSGRITVKAKEKYMVFRLKNKTKGPFAFGQIFNSWKEAKTFSNASRYYCTIIELKEGDWEDDS